MRQRVIRAREAAELLIGLLPVLEASAGSEREFETAMERRIVSAIATGIIKNAMERGSIEPLVAAAPHIKPIIVGRIRAFRVAWPKEPDRVIARVPRDSDVRVRMLAALAALLPRLGDLPAAKR